MPVAMLEPSEFTRRSLRIALVTETYPPEVNGVALTVARIAEGLRERGHELQLVRPRQAVDVTALPGHSHREWLVAGAPIPCYPHLRFRNAGGARFANAVAQPNRIWCTSRPRDLWAGRRCASRANWMWR